jgi:arginyl-tRNA synthetase
VYYVQYAHARICSVLAQRNPSPSNDQGANPVAEFPADPAADLTCLSTPVEIALMARLAEWPDTVRGAVDELAPHLLAYYLRDLAADFHSFYNAQRVLVDDAGLRTARLALLAATRQVLRNGLALIGVSAPQRM